MIIVIAAECNLWNKLHKIKLRFRDYDDSCSDVHTDTSKVSIHPQMIHDHILNYMSERCGDDYSSRIEEMQVMVEIYHPDGHFVRLLDSVPPQEDFLNIFGTRLRCIINVSNSFATNTVHLKKDGDETLMIKGRFFDYDPNGMDFAGKTLIVQEDANNQEEDGTGLNVWDGSLLLARYLEAIPEKVKGKTVLELGSGPAVVGIAAALLGANEVILSDLEYTLPLMRKNVQMNKDMIENGECERIECMEIDWYSPPDVNMLTAKMSACESFPEVMLIADCVWLEELVIPLMNTVKKLCQQGTEVIITYQRRGKAAHDLFFEQLENIFSFIEDIDTKEDCDLDKPESLILLICHL